jgi:hypothetical protein
MEATARDIIRPIKVGRQVRHGAPADTTLPILIVEAPATALGHTLAAGSLLAVHPGGADTRRGDSTVCVIMSARLAAQGGSLGESTGR